MQQQISSHQITVAIPNLRIICADAKIVAENNSDSLCFFFKSIQLNFYRLFVFLPKKMTYFFYHLYSVVCIWSDDTNFSFLNFHYNSFEVFEIVKLPQKAIGITQNNDIAILKLNINIDRKMNTVDKTVP